MSTRFRYFPPDNVIRDLGLYVCDVGWQQTSLEPTYPIRCHPDGYYYTWETGRRLSEYQLGLIFAGKGIVEFKRNHPIVLTNGSLLLFSPGQWHRCKPDAKIGWGTLWIGFDGKMAPALVRKIFPDDGYPVRTVAKAKEFKYAAMRFIAYILKNGESQPFSSAGELICLLGNLAEGDFDQQIATDDSSAIRQARTFISQHCTKVIDFKALAESISMTYDVFRHSFVTAIGSSPLQFQLSERLRTAKNLVANTNLPMKEIATRTGFSSAAYFSRFFKNATKMPPFEYRTAQSTACPKRMLSDRG